jgi:hypothetical protein
MSHLTRFSTVELGSPRRPRRAVSTFGLQLMTGDTAKDHDCAIIVLDPVSYQRVNFMFNVQACRSHNSLAEGVALLPREDQLTPELASIRDQLRTMAKPGDDSLYIHQNKVRLKQFCFFVLDYSKIRTTHRRVTQGPPQRFIANDLFWIYTSASLARVKDTVQ